MKLISVERIWNRAAHNAFTDMTRFNSDLYITFREGEQHISDAGRLRILRLVSGSDAWQDAGKIALEEADLRDAKLSVTPDNRLMLISAAALAEGPITHQTKAWFSIDGVNWSAPKNISEPNHWLWRLNWHENCAYGFAYGTGGVGGLYWYCITPEGTWTQQRLAEFDGQYVNEHDLCFEDDGTAWCLLRRDNADPDKTTGLLGCAKPPYQQWHWQDLGFRIGGPCLIWDEKETGFIAAYRRYEHPAQWLPQWTEVSRLSKRSAMDATVELPSGGDCSYPGLVLEGDRIRIVYYSSHEEQSGTAIYLAEIDSNASPSRTDYNLSANDQSKKSRP
ncbi:MAG: exo-alpha-sialidase [Oceanospirillales bacterium]|nr:exo-alpha-sialidase [Oceanospirillales bacterium]